MLKSNSANALGSIWIRFSGQMADTFCAAHARLSMELF